MIREGPTAYKIVILSDVVHQFTLPNPERTNVHNNDYWHYSLEIQDESPTPPPIPLVPEYHPILSYDSSSSSDGSPPIGERRTELQTIQTNLTTLRTDLSTLCRDFMNYTNMMAEQMDHIYQEI